MSSDQELATEISRQLQRLSAQFQEQQRDLQKRGGTEGAPLVQSALKAAERLAHHLHVPPTAPK